uniref:uncharacterized protein LOC122609746 n=1 Tax=Erigeron canadensis TaxID=72917 RepID=UPI001CB987E4|nr:uncharacterized protein LOC122609746 [Erigeron canadensis]
MVTITQHEHPLRLIDLQPNFPHYEEDYDDDSNDDDDDDLSTQKAFPCFQCDRCDKEINWFHRYYYKCKTHSCDYSLHKFCGDLPLTLKHTSHPDHTLTLSYDLVTTCYCVLCRRYDRSGFCFKCSKCNFQIHANCVIASTENPFIYHPSHGHPLAAILKPISSNCNACGKTHNGTFYLCVTCYDFCIHSDCVFLPKTLKIQDTTKNIFFHNHPLILSYSFPDQEANFYPRCRVCNKYFTNENLWIFKCEKCRYYTHLDCTTSKEESFMPFISSFGKNLIKDYENSSYPDLIHLPFPDESYSILKHLFFKNKRSYGTSLTTSESNLRNFHQHSLTLVHTSECNDISKPSSSRTNNVVSCHNPMTKIELLCNGCVRPITSMPFYKCANEDENCNFVLHEWCTRVPMELKDYPDHPQHPLKFHPNVPDKRFSIFYCRVCDLWGNGFAYSCVQCDYHIDVKCGFIPEKITHQAHPNHVLSRVQEKVHYHPNKCRLCLEGSYWDPFSFLCHTCNVFIHVNCALLLPREIRHKCDKHPLSLSYFPVENHKGEYYCEVCEEEFDPQRCFHHCYECVQSIHSTCAPLIIEFERVEHRYRYRGIYQLVNINVITVTRATV